MSFNVEKLENSMAKITIEVAFDEFNKAVDKVYLKQKGRIQLPGFRKGKAPRHMIEKMYGEGVFYEDAVNDIIPDAYSKAAAESGLDITSQPDIDVVQLEKGKPFIFTATVALKPELKLGQYKGVEVEKRDTTVTEEAITAEIDKERESNARMIEIDDRAVEDGDTVNVDYEGSIDGVPFDGGKADGYELVIGSHTFIDTFEDQLIGKNIGEDVEVNVTFPEEYHSEELAGKPALFKVKINGIQKKELPELDDEFAQDVSEFDTFAEYKESVATKLKEQKEKDAKYIKEREAVAQAADNSEVEIPTPMLETQVTYMIDDFGRRIKQQGLTMEQYMQFTGLTYEQMQEQMRPEAVKRIKSRLTLEAVVAAEKIEISDERVDEEIEKMAKRYGMKFEDLKKEITEPEIVEMKMDLACEEASAFIGANAVEVEKKEEAEEKPAKKTTKKATTKKAAKTDDAEEKPAKKTTAKKTTTKKTTKAADEADAEAKPKRTRAKKADADKAE